MEMNPVDSFFADFRQQSAVGQRRWKLQFQRTGSCRGFQDAGLLVNLAEVNIEQRGKVLKPGLVLGGQGEKSVFGKWSGHGGFLSGYRCGKDEASSDFHV